jgi:hypothetical protein
LDIDLNFETPDQSEWTLLVRSIEPSLDGLKLSDLVENSTNQDISFLATQVGKSTEVVMRAAVSARLDTAFKIPAAAFYAFLRQQVPATLPSPLLDASQNFTLIDTLGQNIGSLIFGLSAQVQTRSLRLLPLTSSVPNSQRKFRSLSANCRPCTPQTCLTGLMFSGMRPWLNSSTLRLSRRPSSRPSPRRWPPIPSR